jgi:hypothetical protein
MTFRKIETFAQDEVRPASIFAFNMHGTSQASGWPDPYFINSNSWHRVACPVPMDALFVEVVGMFVGGAQACDFFFHVDVRDPHEQKTMESGGDWSDVNGSGTFYTFYCGIHAPYHNLRTSFGMFRWPVYQQRALLRWKLDDGGGGTGNLVYDNPVGINVSCVGYGMPAPSTVEVAAERSDEIDWSYWANPPKWLDEMGRLG